MNMNMNLSTDGSGRGAYLFALVLLLTIWQFTIPPSFRRSYICPNDQCIENRADCRDCVTPAEWRSDIVDYYRNGGGIQWDFSIDPKKAQGVRRTIDTSLYEYPVKPIKLTKTWPVNPPFTPQDFDRADPSNDGQFYALPKLVYHIDEPAVAALTTYYQSNIPSGSDILDICSSWVSHYPKDFPSRMGKIYGTGINKLELKLNNQLTGGYTTTDLNEASPKLLLPYDDSSVDVVTCVVSIDYLIHPIETLREVNRVLRPGGKVIISQSDRYFPSKAISMWVHMESDLQHLELIDGYFQYAGGFQEPRKAFDITPTILARDGNSHHDPLYIIEAIKSSANE